MDCSRSLSSGARSRDPLARNDEVVLLPPLQHDLATRLARLQQRMRSLEIGGVDGAKGLVERGAQDALVDEVRDIVEQIVLRDHVRRLERGCLLYTSDAADEED